MIFDEEGRWDTYDNTNEIRETSREETELAACCCVSGFLPLLMVSSGRSAKKRAFKAQFMQSQIAPYPSIEQQRMMAQQNMMAQQQMAAQQTMNAKIILKEKQRIAAEQEAVRLLIQMTP